MEESIQTIQSNTLLIIFAVVSLTGIICSKISDIHKNLLYKIDCKSFMI